MDIFGLLSCCEALGASQVAMQMGGHVGGVVTDPVDEARVPAALKAQAEGVQARPGCHATVVDELAAAIEDGDLQPRVASVEPGRPHDGGDPLVTQVEHGGPL